MCDDKEIAEIAERWKEVQNYPNYEVSDLGKVRRIDSKGVTHRVPQRRSKVSGHYSVSMYNAGVSRTFKVCRLVAEAFCPNDDPETLKVIGYIDNDRTNDKWDNLQWAESTEGFKYCISIGSRQITEMPKGEDHHNSRVTEEQVREIRKGFASGQSILALSVQWGVSYPATYNIAKRKTWKHIL